MCAEGGGCGLLSKQVVNVCLRLMKKQVMSALSFPFSIHTALVGARPGLTRPGRDLHLHDNGPEGASLTDKDTRVVS